MGRPLLQVLSMHLIKRYPNRKLYDTATKRYISLDGVERLIHAGVGVKVVDVRSGYDVTAVVLTRVLLNMSRRSFTAVAVSPLVMLIQAAKKAAGFVALPVGEVAEPSVEESAAMTGGYDAVTITSFPEELVLLALERAMQRLNLLRRSDLQRLETTLADLSKQVDLLEAFHPRG